MLYSNILTINVTLLGSKWAVVLIRDMLAEKKTMKNLSLHKVWRFQSGEDSHFGILGYDNL